MIVCYFGVPRVGKSTRLVKEYIKNRKYFKNVYSVNITIKGVKRITKEDFRKYNFPDSLILWDEITLDYDNRDFKAFTEEDKKAWLLHGHNRTTIIYATQNYEMVDKKIRDITHELWYMSKINYKMPIITNITKSQRIYRTININENTSDLTLGYRFCQGLERLFASNVKIDYRPKYYKYFDTYEEIGGTRQNYDN